MAVSDGSPTPQMVGNAFVEQYYSILHQEPDQVHRFYHESSVVSRPEEDGSMTMVTTTVVSTNDGVSGIARTLCNCRFSTGLMEFVLKYSFNFSCTKLLLFAFSFQNVVTCINTNQSKIYGNHLGLCAFHEKGCAIFLNFVVYY